MTNHTNHKALALLRQWGVAPSTFGTWAFTDIATARTAYVHHSSVPAALAAYAAIDPIYARGRFPDMTLIDLVHKRPSMDHDELTALAWVCGADEPPKQYANLVMVFGSTVWDIVDHYELGTVFERVPKAEDQHPHMALRPRGFKWHLPDWPKDEAALRAMRKAYKALEPVPQIMALTVLHLYLQRPDRHYLLGGCPTKIHAADALDTLRAEDPQHLQIWARLVTAYPGW
jgi:hypothetical protein